MELGINLGELQILLLHLVVELAVGHYLRWAQSHPLILVLLRLIVLLSLVLL